MTRRNRPALMVLACLTLLSLLVAGCGSSGEAQARTVSAPVRTAARPSAGPAKATNRVTKVLVFMVENHSMAQMQSGMPWVYRLAKRYGRTTRYHAITHPSLPNYLSIAGGSSFGVRDDNSPSAHRLGGASVFGRAITAGRTAGLYAESMPHNCTLDPAGRYAVKHNPWAYFPSERSQCSKHDVPLSHLAGDISNGRLPNVGMVIPNLCDDAHDCSLAVANRWLKAKVGAVLAGPDFTSGRLAVVITADEDDDHSGNKVLTVVAQRSLHGKVVGTPLNHFGLSRSLAQVGHFSPLRGARSSASVLKAFGLQLG
ncbi:MAG: alkaline phosphatase family protein [Nocardioidaceae bacterium]|nr:alkaline phosphatase family protein [Nocardioidaceae bacterium]MCL2612100.1 alkaline phosphatase family protein [Nocardioidaceae bacterium]